MKRDVQVGVILGVIILAIIGVFLSTRTNVKEPIIPIPEIDSDASPDLLSLNELPKNPEGLSPQGEDLAKKEDKISGGGEPKKENIDQEPAVEEQDYVIEGELRNAGNAENKIATSSQKQAIKNLEHKYQEESILPAESSQKSNVVTYKVQERDTLHKIAKKYYGDDNKWLLIFNANQDRIYDRNNIRVGTELIIPNKNETPTQVSTERSTRLVTHEVTEQTTAVKKHVVQAGDSLYKIALKYYKDGSKWKKILNANKHNIKNENALKAGQELVIPDI
ncbi:LysM peptidoglycan-binding domain-containing protein [Candidatus Kuenenia sp.]|uniref:LysM peptidoglycan-binding domain-containing protein n=1 Tax=Candidatus Kuenenia sp. TaxID=2499824 RepID=UPI00321FAA62